MNNTFLQINNIFKNKSICLVGPANSLVNASLGKMIESYDLICGCNNVYLQDININDYGTRQDVLLCRDILYGITRYSPSKEELREIISTWSQNLKKKVLSMYCTSVV